MGLLLLRAVIGLTLLVQGVAYLTDWAKLTLQTSAVGALAIASGICLLAGFLTPIACVMVVLVSIAFALSWFPMPAENLFDDYLVIVNVIVMTTAIAFLGPGALSLDARLFGRREIAIPNTSRHPRF